MPNNMVLLETIALTQSAASVTFDNLPTSGYTDLKVVISARSTQADTFGSGIIYYYNGANSSLSTRRLYGQGNGTVGSTGGSVQYGGMASAASQTANTFGNSEVYIPNYRGSTNKSSSSDGVSENNATNNQMMLSANLWSNTAAITSITFLLEDSSNFLANSTFSLYGVAALGTTPVLAPKATGGNRVENDGTYWIHTFLTSGIFTPQVGLTCDYLVVAGGGAGGGGNNAGGGGAGGLRSTVTATGGGGSLETALSVSNGINYAITIGAGGAGVNGAGLAASGSNSTFSTITSTGGGGGYGGDTAGQKGANGGSGGGSNYASTGTPATGTTNQGFAGAAGAGTGGPSYQAGGGGGAGEAGNTDAVGDGGDGVAVSITGSSVTYAGGGGGGINTGTSATTTGGTGGGGNGANNVSTSAVDGTANTGGGAGGTTNANPTAKSGGSGIVIIRYPIA